MRHLLFMPIVQRLTNQIVKDISVVGSLPFLVFFSILLISIQQYVQGYLLIIGLFVLFIFIAPIRFFFFRQRPQAIAYDSWIERIDSSSFPSMHAARVGFLLVVFDFAILFWIVSVLVCLSRYYLHKHYISDLVVGFVLGILIAIGVVFLFDFMI